MATVLTGLAFGASLVASGVYQPSVIRGQLDLSNWHMIQAFLTATATSSSVLPPPPTSPPTPVLPKDPVATDKQKHCFLVSW